MENITGTEMHGIQKMGYQENMAVYSGSHVFLALFGHMLQRILKSNFSAVMLNCNNWVDFWRT